MSARTTAAPVAAPQAGVPQGTASHGTAPNVEATGRRVEDVLDRLAQRGDGEITAAAEELVSVLMDFYGAGLARMMHHLGTGDDGPRPALLRDELVTSLLVLHDLHPEDAATRIDRALDSVRRQHAAQVTEFDAATGALRLRAGDSGGCGCPSTDGQAHQAVEAAVACYAPEVTSVQWETAGTEPEPALLQISRRPPTGAGTP
ncbi:hypothetical protein [Streptomyces kronopolitis]|uniref:hypothetical protein n=1 Tax=Streptomyces kronopolitis TaxID=1612435 RepID=UPI003415F7B3